ncbi:MAG TPA: NADH-quinone oxidoreductase subunit NuoF [Anaerolineales bacterium]|nr:NADH-quinone oxidoreductase subunit NuoF [Anaerolineales bacterium]
MTTARAMVLISGDPDSMQRGAAELFDRLQAEIEARDLSEEISLSMVHDIGRHDVLPVVIVYPEAVVYGPVKPSDAAHLVDEHLYKGRVVEELLAPVRALTGQIAWLRARKGPLPAEQRVVLRRAGLIDPESLDDYLIHDGYQALGKALTQMTPEEVIEEVLASGLQGRGGAGFPVGRKWRFVASAPGEKKYVICNADESEPGTFKDRLILEGDPFAIIEAMTIAAYAVGANEGYIYIRGEYPLAYERLEKAIKTARSHGLLGQNIFDSCFDFDIHVHAGAGAYICGEETALIESIEGKRGEPRARPPYPPTRGLWGMPTLVNNVESLANIPPILQNGSTWYRRIGTPDSAGTKVFTILGNVNQTGLIEVPMGITLREIVSIYAKGMSDGYKLKLFQTGGSSGSIVPASLQDTPLGFESFRRAGVSMGSGALLICDERTCVVDLAKVLMQFFRFESCGKCTPCRVGTQQAYEMLTRMTEGQGKLEDIDRLLRLSDSLQQLSNCGLGQTAAVPLRDILHHYRAEVEAHILLGSCPAGICAMSNAPVPA